MKRSAVSLFLTTIVALAGAARADAPAPCTPKPGRAEKVLTFLEDTTAFVDRNGLTNRDVMADWPHLTASLTVPGSLRMAASLLRCDSALQHEDNQADFERRATAADELAKEVETVVQAEATCRTTDACMAERVCLIVADRRDLMSQIAREKANPSGVVDLRRLHDLGERAQADDVEIANRKVRFTRERHKAFAAKCP